MAYACFHPANMVCADGTNRNCAIRRMFWMAATIRLPGERHGRLVNCSVAESLPKRSAVVTRRSEPATTRILARFGKFTMSDAASWRVFLGQPGNQRQSRFGRSDCSRQQRPVSERDWRFDEGQGTATRGSSRFANPDGILAFRSVSRFRRREDPGAIENLRAGLVHSRGIAPTRGNWQTVDSAIVAAAELKSD